MNSFLLTNSQEHLPNPPPPPPPPKKKKIVGAPMNKSIVFRNVYATELIEITRSLRQQVALASFPET